MGSLYPIGRKPNERSIPDRREGFGRRARARAREELKAVPIAISDHVNNFLTQHKMREQEDAIINRQVGSLFAGIDPVVYRGEDAKISQLIATKIQGLNEVLPPEDLDETGNIPLVPISFDAQTEHEFHSALFYIGDFLNTDEEVDDDGVITKQATIFFVRPRTQQVLAELGIPYRLIDLEQGAEVGQR